MERTVALGATSGSISALLFRLAADALAADPQLPSFDCPICPELPIPIPEQLDGFSLLVGLAIGVSLGPILELLYLLRQSWRCWVQSRLAKLARQPQHLYRLG